jgi:hypothetical protein
VEHFENIFNSKSFERNLLNKLLKKLLVTKFNKHCMGEILKDYEENDFFVL